MNTDSESDDDADLDTTMLITESQTTVNVTNADPIDINDIRNKIKIPDAENPYRQKMNQIIENMDSTCFSNWQRLVNDKLDNIVKKHPKTSKSADMKKIIRICRTLEIPTNIDHH